MACPGPPRVARWSSASPPRVVTGTRDRFGALPHGLGGDPGDGLDLVPLGPDRLGAASSRRRSGALLQAAPERLEALLARLDPLLCLALVGLVPHEVGLDRVDAPRQGRQLHLGVQERLRAPSLVVRVDLDPPQELRDLGRHARRPRLDLSEPLALGQRLGLDAGASARELGDLRAERLRRQADPSASRTTCSEILRRRQPARPRRPPARWHARCVVERGDARFRPAPAPGLLHLELQEISHEVADRALPGEERGVAAARGAPAAEGAGRAQQLAADGHEARAVTVLGGQARCAETAPRRPSRAGWRPGAWPGRRAPPPAHHAGSVPTRLPSAVQPVER
jgi:hypothetical protein